MCVCTKSLQPSWSCRWKVLLRERESRERDNFGGLEVCLLGVDV